MEFRPIGRRQLESLVDVGVFFFPTADDGAPLLRGKRQ